MENDKRHEVYLDMMELLECGFDIMMEYGAAVHTYDDIKLYQSETKILQYLGYKEGKTITEIANENGKSVSAYSQIIRRLKQKGLVKQIRNEKNAREYNLYLTEKGKRIFNIDIEYLQKYYDSVFQNLDEFTVEELMTFCKMQKKLNETYSMAAANGYRRI